MTMKKYVKPQIATVTTPEAVMGDVNIGIASKPDPTPGELPASAKKNDFMTDWDDDDELDCKLDSL